VGVFSTDKINYLYSCRILPVGLGLLERYFPQFDISIASYGSTHFFLKEKDRKSLEKVSFIFRIWDLIGSLLHKFTCFSMRIKGKVLDASISLKLQAQSVPTLSTYTLACNGSAVVDGLLHRY